MVLCSLSAGWLLSTLASSAASLCSGSSASTADPDDAAASPFNHAEVPRTRVLASLAPHHIRLIEAVAEDCLRGRVNATARALLDHAMRTPSFLASPCARSSATETCLRAGNQMRLSLATSDVSVSSRRSSRASACDPDPSPSRTTLFSANGSASYSESAGAQHPAAETIHHPAGDAASDATDHMSDIDVGDFDDHDRLVSSHMLADAHARRTKHTRPTDTPAATDSHSTQQQWTVLSLQIAVIHYEWLRSIADMRAEDDPDLHPEILGESEAVDAVLRLIFETYARMSPDAVREIVCAVSADAEMPEHTDAFGAPLASPVHASMSVTAPLVDSVSL